MKWERGGREEGRGVKDDRERNGNKRVEMVAIYRCDRESALFTPANDSARPVQCHIT
jgi:hypothetical protein